MNNNLIVIIVTMIFLVVVSGCINLNSGDQSNKSTTPSTSKIKNDSTGKVSFDYLTSKKYNANGVTFNYPAGWKEVPPSEITFEYPGTAEKFAVVGDENNPEIFAVFERESPNVSLAQYVADDRAEMISHGDQILSQTNVRVDGAQAIELISSFNLENGLAKKERWIVFDRKNTRYSIIFSAPSVDFDLQKSNFDLIVSSFHVK